MYGLCIFFMLQQLGFLEEPKKFLARRQGPLPEGRAHKSSRCARNFGGADFSNVKQQMQHEGQVCWFEVICQVNVINYDLL